MIAHPPSQTALEASPTLEDLEALAAFRFQLRVYLNFAERAAAEHGLTMQQHQALLALRVAPAHALSVSGLAQTLILRHHSAVELTDRLVKAGLVERRKDMLDGRKAIVALTAQGSRIVDALALAHLARVKSEGRHLARALHRIRSNRTDRPSGSEKKIRGARRKLPETVEQ